MTVYLKQRSFLPYIDYALLSKQTMKMDNNHFYKDKALYYEDPPKEVVPKLYSAKVLSLHPDDFDTWTDILIELSKKKTFTNLKLIIIHGSDYLIDDILMEIVNSFLPNTTFLIQNYMGVNLQQNKLLPIGVVCDYNEEIEKKEMFNISFVTYNSFYRQEFYQFLKDNDDFTKKYYKMKTDISTYFKQMSEVYFSACPMGNGFDTHRFWEALTVKTIPILKKHTFNEALQDYFPNLPFIEIESWDDLPKLVETLTVEKYNEMMEKADFECLKESYWIEKLNELTS